jgi:hypothetical protein
VTSMAVKISFEQTVAEIEAAYIALEHKLGWRFLNVSKDVLRNNPQIALITANPGGDSIPPDHGTASCESGCAYLSEIWGNSKKGQSSLQKQVQWLFDAIANQINFADGGEALMESSLIAYYIPFRSPRLAMLPHKKASLGFARSLWSSLFEHIHPKLILTIDPAAFKAFGELLQQRFSTHPPQHRVMQTGWGAYTAEVKRFGHGDNITTLVRLPHLSTFKLFSRSECKPFTDEILAVACVHL